MDENPHRDEDHSLSENKSNTDEHKVATAIAAITDPKFPLPTLSENTSPLRYVLSFTTLAMLVGAGVIGAWYLDMELLRSSQPIVVLSCAFATVIASLFFTGAAWIDWFGLVYQYWWLSMPIGALAGLALVLNQEASTGMGAVA